MFWNHLAETERGLLRKNAVSRDYDAGDVMFLEGQHPDLAFIVLGGEVRLTKGSRDGKQVLLELRGPGELVGELGVLDNKPRSATATALTPVVSLAIPRAQFNNLLHERTALSAAVLLAVVERLRQSANRTRETGTTVARTRLASRLFERAQLAEPAANGTIVIQPNLSQEDWASWIGVSRHAVVAALRTLRKDEVVWTGRSKITVLDMERLRSYADC